MWWIYLASFMTQAQPLPKQVSSPVPAVVRQGEVVNEALAQVSDHVITHREVVLSHLMEQAWNQKVGEKTLDRSRWILKSGTAEFQRHFSQVIMEIVVQLEAENFSVGQLSPTEIEGYRRHLSEMTKNWEPWTRLEVSESEIEQMIGRKLRAKNFLKFKMETSGVQISDEEAKSYFERNRVKFGSLPFSQFRDGIKEVLAQEQMQTRLKDWFDVLKRKYRLRFLGANSPGGT